MAAGRLEVHIPPPFRVPCHGAFPPGSDWLQGQVRASRRAAHHRFDFIHPLWERARPFDVAFNGASCGHWGRGAWSDSHGLSPIQDGLRVAMNTGNMQLADVSVRAIVADPENSLAAWISFTNGFLAVCEDQVSSWPACSTRRLGERHARYAALSGWAKGRGLAAHHAMASTVDVAALLGVAPRTDGDEIGRWVDGSETPRGAELRFPSKTHDVLFPRLFEDLIVLRYRGVSRLGPYRSAPKSERSAGFPVTG